MPPPAAAAANAKIRGRTVMQGVPLGPNGGCFAVAVGPQPGIYFSLAEIVAPQIVVGVGAPPAAPRFASVREARAYLAGHGLAPRGEDGGWLAAAGAGRHRPPIFYVAAGGADGNGIVASGGAARTKRPPPSSGQGPLSPHRPPPGGVPTSVERQSEEEADQEREETIPPSSDGRRQPTQNKKARVIEIVDTDSDGEKEAPATGSASSSSAASADDCATEVRPSAEGDGPVHFDAIQQRAIDAALGGKNVFLTGVAGTGKSLVTQAIVRNARTELRREVACAAPTGVAAVNLGPELAAQTVHSLAGVGVPQAAGDFARLLSVWTAKRWAKIEVLVLDEIGMLQADFLDWLDVFVRRARKRPLEAFGGIQLIFVGDFAQLGPIPGRVSLRDPALDPTDDGADCLLGISECAAYAFQTALWREANFHHVHLRQVYRQSNSEFVEALMDIREARADTALVQNLVRECSPPLEGRAGLEIPEGIKPTILYCTNRNVDKENYDNLARLQTEHKQFKASDSVSVSGDVSSGARDVVHNNLLRNPFFNDCTAARVVHLKVGAQVMLLQNLDLKQGLVNGSRGVVEAFKLCPVVRDVGKNQEERLIGPGDVDKFPGCRFDELKFGQKAEFDGKVWRICRFEKYPLVRFMNNVSRIIVPETFERTLYRQGTCHRIQLPLRLAWALTIHKSQGATLDLVVCDLQGCFTSGQAYVALSRARSVLGLQINNFDPKYVTADPLVEGFYRALDQHTMGAFLEEEAGLWWYPILHSPSWLHMFTKASSKLARDNAKQFREWVQDYSPMDGYSGWGGIT